MLRGACCIIGLAVTANKVLAELQSASNGEKNSSASKLAAGYEEGVKKAGVMKNKACAACKYATTR